MNTNDDHDPTPRFLIGVVLHDLATDAESLLLLSSALEERVTGITSRADPQKLREVAALVKSAALQVTLAAANMVGSAERLRLVAEFAEVGNGAGRPS